MQRKEGVQQTLYSAAVLDRTASDTNRRNWIQEEVCIDQPKSEASFSDDSADVWVRHGGRVTFESKDEGSKMK